MSETGSKQEREDWRELDESRVAYSPPVSEGEHDHTRRVLDVQISRSISGRVAAIAVPVVVALGVVTGVVALLDAASVSAAGIVCSLLVIVLVVVAGILLAFGVGDRSAARALANSKARDAAELAGVLLQHQNWMGEVYTRRFLRELITRGWWGTTLRLWKHKPPAQIRPFDFTFEPRVVDEADASLRALMAASEDESVEAAVPSFLGQRTAECSPLLRRLRRNITMGGGWVVFLCFLPGIFWAVYDLIQSGKITGVSMLFGVAVVLPLLIRRGHGEGPLGSKQLLMVPGGLLLRKSKRGGVSSELHLFRRDASVLCALPHYGKSWRLLLKDEGQSDAFYITETELNVALRAWLSPIEPPPVERLSDLT